MRRTIYDYLDMISLPHHVSSRHAPMPRENRAAQFAPFAALTGYDASIHEAARYTDSRIEPDEDLKNEIDAALSYIYEHMQDKPQAVICYFVSDTKKHGGKYVYARGSVIKFDTYGLLLYLSDGTVIPVKDIISIRLLYTEQP